jgi:Leucine-rich repeat (LRR) protein
MDVLLDEVQVRCKGLKPYKYLSLVPTVRAFSKQAGIPLPDDDLMAVSKINNSFGDARKGYAVALSAAVVKFFWDRDRNFLLKVLEEKTISDPIISSFINFIKKDRKTPAGRIDLDNPISHSFVAESLDDYKLRALRDVPLWMLENPIKSQKAAEELIQKECRERTGSLSLARLNIDRIPDSIRSVPWLTRLSCRASGLQTLSGVEWLPNLEIIQADRSGISDLRPLRALRKLEGLDLEHCPLQFLDGIEGCTTLLNLYLSHTNISSIGQIRSLTSLEYIFINGTRVNSLDEMPDLPNLKRLLWNGGEINGA